MFWKVLKPKSKSKDKPYKNKKKSYTDFGGKACITTYNNHRKRIKLDGDIIFADLRVKKKTSNPTNCASVYVITPTGSGKNNKRRLNEKKIRNKNSGYILA